MGELAWALVEPGGTVFEVVDPVVAAECIALMGETSENKVGKLVVRIGDRQLVTECSYYRPLF
jgi:hypothetical protein